MQPADILFEKIIQDGSIEKSMLITASEHRRSFLRSLHNNLRTLQSGLLYYESLKSIISKMKENNTTLMRQPLFLWNNVCSNSFLYEKLNVENEISSIYEKEASNALNLKQKRSHYLSACDMSKHANNTLSNYHWEDTCLRKLRIMQDRYHLNRILLNSARFYDTMNNYSMKEKNVSNAKCIERAFYFADAAYHVWEDDIEVSTLLYRLKCLHVLECARGLDDDKCGEKVAMLRDYIDTANTPEILKAEYTKWDQQNNQVYFQKEETDFEITYPSLEDLFQNLPKSAE